MTRIRNRRQTQYDHQPVVFRTPPDLFNTMLDICARNDLSISQFIRESCRRNVKLYEKQL